LGEKIMGAYLQQSHINLLHEIAQYLKVPHFYLFGGAALDLLVCNEETTSYKSAFSDLDIAICGRSYELESHIHSALKKAGFDILISHLHFEVNWSEPVTIIKAESEHLVLDIALIEVFTLGQFDLESLYWEYPSYTLFDPHNALGALHAKCLKPIRSLSEENPFLLVARFLKLLRKYQLPFDIPCHLSIGHELADLLVQPLRLTNPFQKSFPPSLALGNLLCFIAECHNRRSGLEFLAKTMLLNGILPEFESIIYDQRHLLNHTTVAAVCDAKTVDEIQTLLVRTLPYPQASDLRQRLNKTEV
jgi:hypothetical protein